MQNNSSDKDSSLDKNNNSDLNQILKKNPLKDKNILLGLTGSIACYKTCELLRMLTKAGANVKTILSPCAPEFIGIKTLETLSNSPVYTNTFAPKQTTEHISLADWADLFVIAPITANTISKFASGIADNLITSIFNAYLGSKKPVIIAPAMNTGMLKNPFVQKNIKALQNEGVKTVQTETGLLACGYEGDGKMASVDKIFDSILETLCPAGVLNNSTSKKKILVTTGGTKEQIDPVRFISNESSGRMGLCLADCAHSMGYSVELISTVDFKKPLPYKITIVSSTLNMFDVVKEKFKTADYLIMAAAVSDYRVKNPAVQKISKENCENLTLKLVQNPDILKEIGKIKKEGQKTIGFSLSTQNLLETAKAKLDKKNADFIIANEAKTALNTYENEVWIIDKAGNTCHIEKNSKENVAKAILERVL